MAALAVEVLSHALVLELAGEAKIHNDDSGTACTEHDIARFEIPVDNVAFLRADKSVEDLANDGGGGR